MKMIERRGWSAAASLLKACAISRTAAVPLVLNPEAMFEYACHEGNYSMPVMLGGARVEEAAAQP